MNIFASILAAASALALAGAANADTRNSNKDKTTMEQKASPATPKSDEERAEASQGQPDVPHPGGTSPRNTTRKGADAKPRSGAKAKESRESPSSGSSAPSSSVPSPDRDAAFKLADMDGDGAVSKAEAAGNEQLVKGFDRADKNRDGKLSRAEYESIFRAKARASSQASR
jgi:hypothetical protein